MLKPWTILQHKTEHSFWQTHWRPGKERAVIYLLIPREVNIYRNDVRAMRTITKADIDKNYIILK